MKTMQGFWKLTWVEFKLFLREPMASFFTLVFPLMMLFLFGSIYGNKPNPFFGGLGFIDTAVPAYTAMIIGTSGLISLSISIASYREQGILRRFKATTLRPQAILGSQVVQVFSVTLLGMILLVIAGKLVFHLRFPGNPLSVFAGFVLGSLSFFALGFIIASVMPTARSSQVTAMVLFYPMLFLSGASIPREVLPPAVRSFSRFLPLTPVVDLLRGLWQGESWGKHMSEAGFLAVIFIAGVLISAKTFKWE
jgi:ABC-2 type transport system permease protein